MNTGYVLEQLDGITYRQLDHWIRKGLLKPDGVGTGNDREWTKRELIAASIMARLVHAGITVDKAGEIARGIVDDPDGYKSVEVVLLAPGIRMTMTGIGTINGW